MTHKILEKFPPLEKLPRAAYTQAESSARKIERHLAGKSVGDLATHESVKVRGSAFHLYLRAEIELRGRRFYTAKWTFSDAGAEDAIPLYVYIEDLLIDSAPLLRLLSESLCCETVRAMLKARYGPHPLADLSESQLEEVGDCVSENWSLIESDMMLEKWNASWLDGVFLEEKEFRNSGASAHKRLKRRGIQRDFEAFRNLKAVESTSLIGEHDGGMDDELSAMLDS